MWLVLKVELSHFVSPERALQCIWYHGTVELSEGTAPDNTLCNRKFQVCVTSHSRIADNFYYFFKSPTMLDEKRKAHLFIAHGYLRNKLDNRFATANKKSRKFSRLVWINSFHEYAFHRQHQYGARFFNTSTSLKSLSDKIHFSAMSF